MIQLGGGSSTKLQGVFDMCIVGEVETELLLSAELAGACEQRFQAQAYLELPLALRHLLLHLRNLLERGALVLSPKMS